MTDRALAGGGTGPVSDAAETARLMGLPSWRKMNSLSLVNQVERGLPLQVVERVARVMAPDDPRGEVHAPIAFHLVPPAEAITSTSDTRDERARPWRRACTARSPATLG